MKEAYDFESAKFEYRELCKREDSINIYMQDWYFDAVCNSTDDWRVILVKEDEKIVAAFPFEYMKIHGFWRIKNPWSVAFGGVWVKERKYRSKEQQLSVLTKIIDKIVDKLPPYDDFHVVFTPELWNWQPFYWHDFSASPYYTMSLPACGDDVKQSFNRTRRNRINKVIGEYQIEVNQISPESYWNFFEYTFRQKGRKVSCEKEQFIKLLYALLDHQACQIRTVTNQKDMLAANIIFEDSKRCYLQFLTEIQSEKTNAISLSVYDAIKYANSQNKIFDFEGSMIQGVSEFYRSFNPQWETTYVISKASRKYNLIKDLRDIFK